MKDDSNASLQQERRRSKRVYVQIRVHVEGDLTGETPFSEDTETFAVNAHGALVGLNAEPRLGQDVNLRNVATNETQQSKVVFVIVAKDGKFIVGIDFAKPNPSFWHMSFPPEDWSTSHPDAKCSVSDPEFPSTH
jgi:hypothetical protein